MSAEIQAEAAAPPAGAPAAPPTAIERAITEYLQHMGVERGLALNTLSAYRRDLTRYARFLAAEGCQAPDQITRHHVTGLSILGI